MDNIDKKLEHILSKELIPPNHYDQIVKETFNSYEFRAKKTKLYRRKLSLIAACCTICLVTGSVFAKDIKNFIINKFEFRQGIQTAIENGYIEDVQIKSANSFATLKKGTQDNIIDEIDTTITIKEFLIDNTNINLGIELKFDEKINNYKNLQKDKNGNFDYENFGHIEFTNIFILDEENRILYAPSNQNKKNQEIFKNFCNEHHLDYNFLDFNENYYNSIFNSDIININASSNTIELSVRISSLAFLGSLNCNFPNSKKLNIFITEVTFVPKLDYNQVSPNKIILNGNWNYELDVPEIMYSRTEESYKTISCENNNFKIYESKATETGFELGILISNIEEPIFPKELAQINETEMAKNGGEMGYPNTREGLIDFYGSEQYANMYEEYWTLKKPINLTGEPRFPWSKKVTSGCYIINSNGKKFNNQYGPHRQLSNFKYDISYDENGFQQVLSLNQYDFYETFEMTKYDATDIITIIIDFFDEPVHIQLEKNYS